MCKIEMEEVKKAVKKEQRKGQDPSLSAVALSLAAIRSWWEGL